MDRFNDYTSTALTAGLLLAAIGLLFIVAGGRLAAVDWDHGGARDQAERSISVPAPARDLPAPSTAGRPRVARVARSPAPSRGGAAAPAARSPRARVEAPPARRPEVVQPRRGPAPVPPPQPPVEPRVPDPPPAAIPAAPPPALPQPPAPSAPGGRHPGPVEAVAANVIDVLRGGLPL